MTQPPVTRLRLVAKARTLLCSIAGAARCPVKAARLYAPPAARAVINPRSTKPAPVEATASIYPRKTMTPSPEVLDEQAQEDELEDEIASCYADPLKHVMISYPWDETGSPLEGRTGPDQWQLEFLIDLGKAVIERGFDGVNAVDPIQFSTSSGHGIGKSCMTAWITRWIMDTRRDAKGIVTANTSEQLRTKTWSELAKWHNMALTKHWWILNAGGGGSMNMYHRVRKETWRVDAQTCREENSEAFAGLHAANSTPFYIFDEASAIPDKIFEVREGGLTDGEPMTFDFGNGTRNSGRFHRNMTGRLRSHYRRRQIDSRSVKITNKKLLDRWVSDYGIDSDFVKVRVLGQFPSSSSLQFISTAAVARCQQLEPFVAPTDPVVIGADIARYGDNKTVIRARHGRDASVYPKIVLEKQNTMKAAEEIVKFAERINADAVFIDGDGVGGGVVDRCRQLGLDVIEVNGGMTATDAKYANIRSQCWGNMRDAIDDGISIDPNDEDLQLDLTALEFGYNVRNRIQLERKEDAMKRGIASPDEADALALTYCHPVVLKREGYDGKTPQFMTVEADYDPYA